MINLYCTHLDVPEASVLQRLISELSKEIQVKIANARFLKDKYRILLSDLLIRKMLAQELDISLNSLEIRSDIHGKPFLVNKNRYFNVSHSNELIVLATDHTPIGIDVEYIKSFNDLEDLITEFTDEEKALYYAKPKDQRLSFFYELWTLKESYLKAVGKGFNCSLQSFNIRVTESEIILTKGIDSDLAWYFQRYTFDNQYKCSICSRHNEFPLKPRIINVSDLLKG